jgi:hypothetical protein
MTVRDSTPTFAPLWSVEKGIRGPVVARLDAVAA